MKVLKCIRIAVLVALTAIGVVSTGYVAAQPGVTVPVESFYDELAPYGQWSQYPGYGNVWQPDAGPDFQPYASDGHWVVTEYGNTWVSDYDWGWAPFHYGRWIFDPAYGGWLWIPGNDWAPAWVSWRSGGGYYGWAPLGPGVNVDVNINIPAPYWTFVPQVYITSPNLYSYRVPRPNVINIYQNTTIINNVYRSNNRVYAYGPPRYELERITRRSVPVYRIDQLNRPGRSVVGNGSVGFYRPGPSANYNRTYNRPDRYDNGQYNGNFNNSPAPTNGYSRNYPDNRRNDYGNGPNGTYPNSNNAPRPAQPDRYEQNRGRYSPNGATSPDGYAQRPERSYERAERQGQSQPGTMGSPQPRANENYQRMPESRGQMNQQRSAQPEQRSQQFEQRSGGGRSENGPGNRSRGPR